MFLSNHFPSLATRGRGKRLQHQGASSMYSMSPIKMLDITSKSNLKTYLSNPQHIPILMINFPSFNIQYLPNFSPLPIKLLGLVICIISLCASSTERCLHRLTILLLFCPTRITLIKASYDSRLCDVPISRAHIVQIVSIP